MINTHPDIEGEKTCIDLPLYSTANHEGHSHSLIGILMSSTNVS